MIELYRLSRAFISTIRVKLWNLHKHYGIPDIYIYVNISRKISDGCTNCVIESGKTSDWFKVQTGVRQGCVMSGFLFIIVVDWMMRSINDRKQGIRWKFMSTQEDLDYADDLALISSKYSDIQWKTTRLKDVVRYRGLNINISKTKNMKINGKRKMPSA